MTIKVAIVEDVQEIRESFVSLINRARGVRCIVSYGTAEEALRGLSDVHVDVVLMDIELPGMSGIDCVRALKVKQPALECMMLTMFENEERVFQSLAAGASGYIVKRAASGKLIEAIKELHGGGSPMSPQIARQIVTAFRQPFSFPTAANSLTKREEEILSLLSKGYRYQEIADALFISVETVRTHIHRMYEKLHVRSRSEAIIKTLQHQ
ncbi:MAG: response regulator transcription factor [Bacteroidota bacterium]|nr:response regulator transcription factor [Bacteroidota bacterium]